MTAAELRDLLVSILAGSRSGGRKRWRMAVGEMHVYPLSTHPHCNWTVKPSGTAGEIEAVERAVDRIRDHHPFVEAVPV